MKAMNNDEEKVIKSVAGNSAFREVVKLEM
jgi:hypothetical protein